MTPETKRQYKDDIARCRAERDAYRSRAAYQWKLKAELNRKRQWLESLKALDRYHEYKRTAIYYDSEMKRLQAVLRPSPKEAA